MWSKVEEDGQETQSPTAARAEAAHAAIKVSRLAGRANAGLIARVRFTDLQHWLLRRLVDWHALTIVALPHSLVSIPVRPMSAFDAALHKLTRTADPGEQLLVASPASVLVVLEFGLSVVEDLTDRFPALADGHHARRLSPPVKRSQACPRH